MRAEAALLQVLRGDGSDGDRRLLQTLFAIPRRDDDFLQAGGPVAARPAGVNARRDDAERVALLFAKALPIRILPLPFDVPRTQEVLLWHKRHETDPAHTWLRELIAKLAKES